MSNDLAALKVNPIFPFNENLSKISISTKSDWTEAVSIGWDEDPRNSLESSKIRVTKWRKTQGDYTKEIGRLGKAPNVTDCNVFTGRPLVSECNILIGIGICYNDERQYFLNLHVDEIMNNIFNLLYKSNNLLSYKNTEIDTIYGDNYTPLVPCRDNS